MKSLRQAGAVPASVPLVADDFVELHASRLLLLLKHCGYDGSIEGLTKLAKLDFFVRYPAFFDRLARFLNKTVRSPSSEVDSPMVRHHYGPWDKRYYQVLAFLEGRQLIQVSKAGNAYTFALTTLGHDCSAKLGEHLVFRPLIQQMEAVRKLLGRKPGNELKNLIYKVFESEVAEQKLGEVIK